MIARAVIVLALASSFGVAGSGSCVAGAQPGAQAGAQSGAQSGAQAAGSAGVIVEFGDRTQEFCVPAGDEPAPALDVLAATGLDLVVQDHGANQLTLCRIDGVGCARDDCFCACRDVDRGCTFWGIYTLGARGGWRFSQLGIGEMRIGAGEVIGLRWDVQTDDGGAHPRTARPRAVCTRVGPVAATGAPGSSSPRAAVLVGLLIAALLVAAARARRREVSS